MRWYSILLPLMGFAIRTVQANTNPQQSVYAPGKQAWAVTHQPAPIATDSIPDTDFTATGLLEAVEDDDYPLVTLTVAFPAKQTTEQFTLNLDEITTIKLTTLAELIGKPISLHYTTEQINDLLDIEVDGRFLLDADPGVVTNNTSRVSGKLGADEVTTGDVLGLLTITAPDGEITEFPFLITSELLEVNGTTVTAFYEVRPVNTITEITIPR